MIESEADICRAIRNHRLLEFRYRNSRRKVEPYAFGVDEGGHPVLRAYQVGGDDDRPFPAWKLFRGEEIADLKVLDQRFAGPHEGYMRNDPAMPKVYCEL
ncbi:MAG TPA: WYL domain-containing protein [Kiloniellales bacterium]|nr:WYL domain-containing protein [Kiloniellales bacterium]